MQRIRRYFCYLEVVTVFFCGAVHAEGMYTLVDLGALEGYPIALSKGLNDSGSVVGTAVLSSECQTRALLYDEEGAHDLGSLGGRVSSARAINNHQVIVGRAMPECEERAMRAFVWTKQEGMRALNDLGGCFGSASGINDEGLIVGTSGLPDGDRHAVLWEPAHPIRDLGTLGGAFSNATAINNHGQVVGRSGLEDGESHAFLWTEELGMQDLGVLDGCLSGARAINDNGQIVGYATDVDGRVGAFLWTEEEGMQWLGDFCDTPFSIANGINDKGVVVGIALWGAFHRAFIWDEASGMRDLYTLIDPPCVDWRLHYAVAINNKGEIAGVGQHNGHYSAFLLQPIEEPELLPEDAEEEMDLLEKKLL